MYGVLVSCFGIAAYLFGVALSSSALFVWIECALLVVSEWIVWYSGMPMTLGVAFALVDLLVLISDKRPGVPVRFDPVTRKGVTVALTAYNDEQSIGEAVRDFRGHHSSDR